MIFTRHAVERYRQFWMLDDPLATDAGALAVLEAHGGEAVKLPVKTARGDEVWTIHALGLELVVKRDMPQPVCVTVLPPARFRGLTPLQAERIEMEQRAALAVATQLEHEAAEVAEALAAMVAPPPVAAKTAKMTPEQRWEAHRLTEQLASAKIAAKIARADCDTLSSVLKTMRTQLVEDSNQVAYKSAIRIAVIALARMQSTEAVEALEAIAEISPGLVSEEFCGIATLDKFRASRRVPK